MSQPGRTMSEAVLAAVAEHEEADVQELSTPLFDVIDPDALDSLFRNGTGWVRFEYLGYAVTIDHEGHVELNAA